MIKIFKMYLPAFDAFSEDFTKFDAYINDIKSRMTSDEVRNSNLVFMDQREMAVRYANEYIRDMQMRLTNIFEIQSISIWFANNKWKHDKCSVEIDVEYNDELSLEPPTIDDDGDIIEDIDYYDRSIIESVSNAKDIYEIRKILKETIIEIFENDEFIMGKDLYGNPYNIVFNSGINYE